MMNHSIIQKTQVEGAHRIDAEYFQPEYLKVVKKLDSIKTIRIGDISESVVNFGAYSLCNYISWHKTGIPYLNVKNIENGYINFEDVKFIDENVNEILKKSKVKEGQIILTMAGTIGNAAVAHNIPKKVNSNQATAKITLKKGFSPYYLTAFLNSYYGKSQTEREIVSSVQPNIFLWQIKNFRIPLLPEKKQREIENIYRLGLNELEKSKIIYSQAENLLLEELGLKNFKVTEDLSYVITLSEAKSVHRIDADFFQPKYERLLSRIKSRQAQLLLDVAQNVPSKPDPNAQPEKSFRYVALADIASSIGVIDGYTELLGNETPSRARRILKTGDVVVSSIEGSLEKVALVSAEEEGYLASTGFFQFRSREILPEVLLVLAKSIVLQMQLKQQTTGTILTAVPKEAIKNMFIPILPQSTQQKIADLVRQSHEAQKKAKKLLEESKQKVERMIEEG